MKKIIIIFSCLLFGQGLLVARAQADTFAIDPARSFVLFKINHMAGYSIGAFQNFGGYIKTDANNTNIASLVAKVDTRSVYTRNQERDNLLRSDLFFNSEKFPEATLIGKTIKDGKLICDVTILGKKKEVAFDLDFGALGKDPQGKSKISVFARGQISRKDFGMKFSPDLDNRQGDMLGDDVEIKLELEGMLLKG